MTIRALILTASALVLGGCGDNAADTVLNVMGSAADVLSAGSPDSVEGGAVVPTSGFTPEEVAADPDSYQLFTINALGVAELARKVVDNGARETYVSQSGFTAAYNDGVLIATRGLVGEDIMAASAPGLGDALRAGGGTINRAIETLDSLNRIQTATFTCTVTAAGVETINLGIREIEANRFDENCRGSTLIFDNIYWLSDDGVIMSSRQYVSPTVAYLRNNRL